MTGIYWKLRPGASAGGALSVAVQPEFHQLERRIEAHIFVSFPAYCLHVHLQTFLA
jgi:hypothetical protein